MSLSFFGLFGQTNKFKTVDVTEFAKAVADTSYVVLDVRTPAEHAEGHISGTHFSLALELGTGFRGWVAAGKDISK